MRDFSEIQIGQKSHLCRPLLPPLKSVAQKVDGTDQKRTVSLKSPGIAFGIHEAFDLRVCPETSGRIAEFSEHEAD
jgi:hypothetical protein